MAHSEVIRSLGADHEQTDTVVVGTNGQTSFPGAFSLLPVDDADIVLVINGQHQEFGVDFTVSGQDLTWVNTAAYSATGFDLVAGWKLILGYHVSGGAAAPPPPPPGEANTASNQGTAGVGVFDNKDGVDLEFRNINAGSSKVTVALDGPNKNIDLDVDEANIDHDALTNFDIAEHRIINDAGTGATELWSASKISTELASTTALPVDDTTSIVQDPVDNTKQVRIDAGTVATSTIRVLSMPDADITPDDASASRPPLAHNHAAADVNSGTFANARIAQSNVTQHEGAIDHDALLNSGANTHAQIDTHIANTANPHGTDIGNLGSGTLAELNTAVTDAVLDAAGDSRPPSGVAGGGLGGSYPSPSVDGMTGGVLTNDAAHGLRGGGTQHAVATGSVSGFMSAADKTKLDSVSAGATSDMLMSFGRNATVVTGGSYLRTADGVSSDPASSPPPIPFAATLIAASIGVDGAPGSSWGIDVQVNGSTVATLTDGIGTATVITDAALSVAVSAGDRIGVRMSASSANVTRPAVQVVFQR